MKLIKRESFIEIARVCGLLAIIVLMGLASCNSRKVTAHADFEFEGIEFKLQASQGGQNSKITNTRSDLVRVRISMGDGQLRQFVILPAGHTKIISDFKRNYLYDFAIHDVKDRMLFFQDDYHPEWGFRVYNKPAVEEVSEPASAVTTTWFGVEKECVTTREEGRDGP